METITGTVEEVSLVEGKNFSRIQQGTVITPVEVKATVLLEGGRRAYVQTRAAEKHSSPGPGFSITYLLSKDGQEYQDWHLKLKGKRDGWPWALVDEGGVSVSPWANAALVYEKLTLMVWAGDKVTIRGSVEEATSARGNKYLNVRRAKILNLERSE